MPSNLVLLQKEFLALFEVWLEQHMMRGEQLNVPKSKLLLESQKYSLLTGGKRFRPFLSFLVCQLYQKPAETIRSYALALEMIHTYSLIHDDLPCMDNDDFRRGKPTNHKVFSEDISLLAGDGLLTDAFHLVATDSLANSAIKIKAIEILSQKTGSFGMVGGQALDMKADQTIKLSQLVEIHTLKTANLIEAAVTGAGLFSQASQIDQNYLAEFGHCLGMAFQIKDDLLDHTEQDQDFKSYVSILGLEKTQEELKNYSQRAIQALSLLPKGTLALQELVEFNLNRSH